MGSASDYLEAELLDHVLKTGAYTVPTNIYVALSTETIDDATTGGDISEPSGGSYARKAHNTWNAAASRATSNDGAITFDEATGDWGTITDWALIDASTDGNVLAYGTFSTSKAISAGDDAVIGDEELDISFSAGGCSTHLANELLDHVFKVGEYTPVTNIYVGLSDTTIDDATTGGDVSEVTFGYARVECNTWNAAVTTGTAVADNTAAITFAAASGSWGTITDMFLADSTDAGNILFYCSVDNSKTVGSGDTVQIDAGSFDVTLD